MLLLRKRKVHPIWTYVVHFAQVSVKLSLFRLCNILSISYNLFRHSFCIWRRAFPYNVTRQITWRQVIGSGILPGLAHRLQVIVAICIWRRASCTQARRTFMLYWSVGFFNGDLGKPIYDYSDIVITRHYVPHKDRCTLYIPVVVLL